jgi:hypothetical protein
MEKNSVAEEIDYEREILSRPVVYDGEWEGEKHFPFFDQPPKGGGREKNLNPSFFFQA